jgi:hypothetical protein
MNSLLEKSYNFVNRPVYIENKDDPEQITETWKPFSMRDSMSLEHFYEMDKTTEVLIPTDGGRYDVNIPKRVKTPVYWKDGLNDEMEVRRASWFSKAGKKQKRLKILSVFKAVQNTDITLILLVRSWTIFILDI